MTLAAHKISFRRLMALLATVLLVTSSIFADSVITTERRVTKLAEGIYTIRHKDPFPGWTDGNTTVIIGDREVFVVDSCQQSAAAQEDIAQIKQWTNKPVRYGLNTHWHTDHNGGNRDYMSAFPGVAIIAQTETRRMMDVSGPNVAAMWLKDIARTQADLRKRLDTGKMPDGTALTEKGRASIAERLAQLDAMSAQAHNFVYQGPTLTFDSEISIDLGNRKVEVKFLGRGNTGGDAIVYLPAERILVTGDLLDHPIPFAFDGYPSEWIRTLERMSRLDAATIVPGHGEVLRDKVFLNQVIDLMKSIVAQVDDHLNRNENATLEDVRKSIDVNSFRGQFVGDNPMNAGFFDNSILSSFVELAYHEAKQR
jgi:cyclase